MIDFSNATPELFADLAAAQAEVENAEKNSANPHFRSKYADLAEVLNTVRPVFAAHGLSLMQSTGFDGALVHVTTAVGHKSGGYVTSTASCAPGKTDAQGIGSATTYLRRYSLSAMTGIAQEDDDGNAAAHNAKPAPAAKAAKPSAKDEAAEAAAKGFEDAMKAATTDAELSKVAKELAQSALPDGLREPLRALYSQRHATLKEPEAA